MKGKGTYQIGLFFVIFCRFAILPCAGYGADLSIGNTVSTTGNWTVNGTFSATSFSGGGSGLSGVNAALLNGQSAADIMGAVADSRSAIEACITITKPGSYYVTQNLTTKGTCIEVTANDVTIDLNGFTLTGDGLGTIDYGVYINNVSNVEVKNGTVRSFSYGIYANYSGTVTVSNRVLNVRAVGNGSGIFLNSRINRIKDCSAVDSTDSSGYGISASGGSTVTSNTACSNQGYGISASTGCTVTNNTACNNGRYGIYASSGSTVTHNTVHGNNTSTNSLYAGIAVDVGCFVKNNTLQGNFENNIRVGGTDNAIEENLVTDSENGISFTAAGNFYANNRAAGNITNYNTGGFAQTDGGGNVGF